MQLLTSLQAITWLNIALSAKIGSILGACYGVLAIISLTLPIGGGELDFFTGCLFILSVGFGAGLGFLMGIVIGLINGLVMSLMMNYKRLSLKNHPKYVELTKYISVVIYMVAASFIVKNLDFVVDVLGDIVLIIPAFAGIGAWLVHDQVRMLYISILR